MREKLTLFLCISLLKLRRKSGTCDIRVHGSKLIDVKTRREIWLCSLTSHNADSLTCDLCLKLWLSWNIAFTEITFDAKILNDRRSAPSPSLFCDCFVPCIVKICDCNLLRNTSLFFQCCTPFFANYGILHLSSSVGFSAWFISFLHLHASNMYIFILLIVFRPPPRHFIFSAFLNFCSWESKLKTCSNWTDDLCNFYVFWKILFLP